MELNVMRSVMTVISFIVFVGIIAWSYSRRRREAFDEAASLALGDDGSGVDVPAQRSIGAKQ
ncbi:cbb3-type cytochrome c oxidase subunit 3 [Ideonella sp. A 288]|uniref:cbb3-type cytochrome oxidase subunit 3 n=1 Tax=Ideonella sp. A 288 TaxID=1962181 RepID=UPI000B4B744F|nr:cbb3-type cytochrome c oxidase subunit 3 [Ideonella sp. A 288]